MTPHPTGIGFAPIVQISDWGEPVPVQQVSTVPEKIDAIGRAFRAMHGSTPAG